MAINFPATPSTNQTYTFNGRTWTWNGVGWQATGSTGLTVYTKTDFTATAGQTSFSCTYTVGFVDVYYNGSKLSTSEYTATTGSTVVLGTACALNDIVETIAWTISSSFNPSLGSASATSLAIGGATIGSNALAVTGTTLLNSALNYGGVTLSNAVTGTGNMVLSASPTLTGTMTAAAANFTSIGIGGTPPSGVPLYVSNSGAYCHLNTTTASYSNVTGFDNGTQRWSIGQAGGNYGNGISFFYGTTEGMRLDSSGRLGIGTTSPAAPLNISGSGAMIRLDGPSTTASAHIGFTHAGSGVCAVGLDIAGGAIVVSSPANSLGIRNDMQGILFSTGGSGYEVGRFGSDGSFLVGTTTNAGAGCISASGSIFPGATTTVSISTNSWSANTWYTLIAAGSLAQGAYWVSFRWDHTGGFPYIIAGSFMASVVNTNGTGADTQITLLTSTHTGGGATGYIRAVAGNSSVTGFQIQFTAIQAGTLTANFYKFA